jgi:hypothetical protein
MPILRCRRRQWRKLDRFFTAEMNDAMRRLQVETQLQHALAVGSSALLPTDLASRGRWLAWSPLAGTTQGVVMPGSFRSPRYRHRGSIGAWVLQTACRRVKEWQDAGWSTRVA